MATYSYFRNIEVTTTTADEELLDNADVRTAIMERLGLSTTAEYTTAMTAGFQDMFVSVFGSGTRISINNETYNELLEDSVYSTSDYVRVGITSIRSETASTVIFSFNIL